MTLPRGMSAEEVLEDMLRLERDAVRADGWQSHGMGNDLAINALRKAKIKTIGDALAAARADERVKACNEGIEMAAKKVCRLCREGQQRGELVDGSWIHWERNEVVGSCDATAIMSLKLPEAPPVEPIEGEGTCTTDTKEKAQ